MNCLETISVRIARQQNYGVALKICTEASLPVDPGRFLGMSIYRPDGYSSDLIIHIRWRFDASQPKKSLLGRQLTLALSNYGIVRHALLIDQDIQFPGETQPV